ncbi:unnamed protein product [Bursaphelenchus xylophilus]|uniref:Tyrosine-protein kinase n=1 Tax=Bursaphelenchus xylophilus TaxID=6326 RepID=A0A1I7RQX2_BURXY|nr:unnamed protein product [Bursaphelenchus xylophilus]CAG9130725.1 unnamed protein product [Bursaphelenchus xylophilus]
MKLQQAYETKEEVTLRENVNLILTMTRHDRFCRTVIFSLSVMSFNGAQSPGTKAVRGSTANLKIDIKLPPGVSIGYDPFENPNEEFLPIDDSFNQVVHPVDKNGHIIFRPTNPSFEKVPTGSAIDPGEEGEPQIDGNDPIQLEEHVKIMDVGENGINEKDYNHGLIPREDINLMLKEPGDFLLRVTSISDNGNRQMCLSVMGGRQHVEHFLIHSNEGKFRLTKDLSFPSIISLVNHYLLKKIPFGNPPVILNKPVCRQDWEFSPDQVVCIKPIGNGAFGQVYFGKIKPRNGENELEVAVKTMKFTLMTKDKIEEIMNEARLMRMLRHENIVRCYGVSADHEPLMILMEFVQGGALDSYLKARNIGITIDDRIQMAYDAARGLNHIHRHGILHRDIAARNCLYGNKILKISDFGLSRRAVTLKVDPGEKAPLRSLAPEVFVSQIFTTAADVWAYGVLLWEIFNNGADPYPGWMGTQIRQEVIKKGSTLAMPDWAPSFVKDILAKTLDTNPAKRMKIHDVIVTIENAKKKKIYQIKNKRKPKNPRGGLSAEKMNPKTKGGPKSENMLDIRTKTSGRNYRKTKGPSMWKKVANGKDTPSKCKPVRPPKLSKERPSKERLSKERLSKERHSP